MTNSIAFLATQSSEMTMTLKEITDMLGVRHDKSMRTVAEMVQNPDFGMIVQIGQSSPMPHGGFRVIQTYLLNKRQSIAVAAKLNVSLLMNIIDRWQELEDAQRAPAKPAYSFLTSTSRERIEHEMALALETYDVLRAVERKMGIGDYTTWAQLRAANPDVYVMQGRNGAPIPNRVTKAYIADHGKEPTKYGLDNGTSQFQGNVYPVAWLMKTVKALVKEYYGVDVELRLPKHITISTPALDETHTATTELQRLGCSEH